MDAYREGGATSTLLADGRVLVTGGSDPTHLSEAELYDPATGQWTKTGSMVGAHTDHTATLLKDGRVLVDAGCDTHTTAELYDPTTGKFARLGKVAVDDTCDSTATLLHDGRVLIAGGSGVSTDSKLAELFDPATGKFTRTGSLHTARSFAQAVLLPDGRVLVIGGAKNVGVLPGGGTNEVDFDSAEIYDPATGKFTETGKMEKPRNGFVATLLTNGKVLVAGGSSMAPDGSSVLASAELYDPSTGKFSETGTLAQARVTGGSGWGNTYTGLLPDGRVLFVGGAESNPATAEIYDPATGRFSYTTAPPQDQEPFGIPAVTLKDGRVLMPGAPSLLYTP
jgi:WD40 repeat protein